MTEILHEAGRFEERVTIKVEYQSWNEKRYHPHSLMITRNGYQWTGMAFASLDEVIGVRDALNAYIKDRGEA